MGRGASLMYLAPVSIVAEAGAQRGTSPHVRCTCDLSDSKPRLSTISYRCGKSALEVPWDEESTAGVRGRRRWGALCWGLWGRKGSPGPRGLGSPVGGLSPEHVVFGHSLPQKRPLLPQVR